MQGMLFFTLDFLGKMKGKNVYFEIPMAHKLLNMCHLFQEP